LTFEDFFMADLAMAPLKIVGFEGVFGSIMMLGLLLPAAYFLPGPEGYGLHENTFDTLAMIKSSRGLQVCVCVWLWGGLWDVWWVVGGRGGGGGWIAGTACLL
jgi:hypothetical protein